MRRVSQRSTWYGGTYVAGSPSILTTPCARVLARPRVHSGAVLLRVRAVLEEPHGAAGAPSSGRGGGGSGGSRPAKQSSIRWARRQRMLVSEPRLGSRDDDLLELNVGGKLMQTTRSTLQVISGSRLASMFRKGGESALRYDSRGRIWLDLDPPLFELVLRYLRETKMNGGNRRGCLPAVQSADVVPFRRLLLHLGLLPYAGATIPIAVGREPTGGEVETPLPPTIHPHATTSAAMSAAPSEQPGRGTTPEGHFPKHHHRHQKQQSQQQQHPTDAQIENSADFINDTATCNVLSSVPTTRGNVKGSSGATGSGCGSGSGVGSRSEESHHPGDQSGSQAEPQGDGTIGCQRENGVPSATFRTSASTSGSVCGSVSPSPSPSPSPPPSPSPSPSPSSPAEGAASGGRNLAAGRSGGSNAGGFRLLPPRRGGDSGGGADRAIMKLSPPPIRTVGGVSQLFYISTNYNEARGLRVSVHTEDDVRAAAAAAAAPPVAATQMPPPAEPFDIFIDTTYGEGQISLTFVSRSELLPGGVFLGLTSRAQLDRKGAQIPCYGWKSNGCTYNDHTGGGRLGGSSSSRSSSMGTESILHDPAAGTTGSKGPRAKLGPTGAAPESGGGASLRMPQPFGSSEDAPQGPEEQTPLWRKGDSVELIMRQGQQHNQLLLKVNGQAVDVINRLPSFRHWSWYVGLWAGGDISCVVFQRDQYAVYWGDYAVKRYL
ncbi:hypothetical protein VaNZ11_004392 [Volvox africanus]|uniref:Potassium channel tetramerisation-type BTB domain-containing protein n=1 Tax=Volvox africanus TaxID=51714 RepID=A0ABQ5RXV3_9CHLO|nr:hypothetical protein VaNZ11_004392 [Volvox africanus]